MGGKKTSSLSAEKRSPDGCEWHGKGLRYLKMCRRLTWTVQTSEKSPLRRGHFVHRGQLEVP